LTFIFIVDVLGEGRHRRRNDVEFPKSLSLPVKSILSTSVPEFPSLAPIQACETMNALEEILIYVRLGNKRRAGINTEFGVGISESGEPSSTGCVSINLR